MIVFDIDDTISPTRPPRPWMEPHEVRRAFGFQVAIPTYLLDFLRTRSDVALLSTWGTGAHDLPRAFDFQARVLLMPENPGGIEGKFEVVQALDGVRVWADDHMRPAMRATLHARAVHTVKPMGGCISRAQLDRIVRALAPA